jgi:hypothetical protein
VCIELLGKPSFGVGKIDEGKRLAGFRRRLPVFFLRRITHQAQPFTNLFAFFRIVDKQRKGAALTTSMLLLIPSPSQLLPTSISYATRYHVDSA